ncbi:hypothetical protein BN946_scf184962.g82 [Trametes cinnabarina]|uniref:Uncharacterized protein n=1 Tax=Pycnoporus cinnabarinus TaxID=5643 RepID=A0A060SIS4_PYCCI|nr:hypothetical protein BN946_scf184962.g82 [Trametes cinnabarina]
MTLRFTATPTTARDPPAELAPDGSDHNALYFSVKGFIEEHRRQLAEMEPLGDHDLDQRRRALIRKADDHLALLERRKAEAWDDEVIRALLSKLTMDKGPLVVKAVESRAKKLQPWLLAALIMASVLHALAAVSRADLQFVLKTLEVVVYGAFAYCNASSGSASSLTAAQSLLLGEIPSDIRTVLSRLDLEPPILEYASCPKCHATYRPDSKRPKSPYPERCRNVITDKGRCKEPLVPDDGTTHPSRTYPYHSLNAWLANVLWRSGLLELCRNAWKETSGQIPCYKDIWDAPALRAFLGPDGKTPFSVQPDGSVHLVFSLFIDWFNPFGNKKAGKSHSIGGVYLVCLNLPPHLRYRPENIYLAGVIPGPTEPDVDQLNHYIRPLVDELLTIWHRGVYLSDATSAWLIRAALIPLVCDLPALRKTAGFASYSAHNFCSFCLLKKDQIDNLDRSTWPRRSRADHYECARKWRDAKTEAERERLFNEHGIRWSELLRLPYWDPTRFALVDAMHNLFLGELRHHCRDVWGIKVKDAPPNQGKSRGMTPHTPVEQQRWLETAASYISKTLPRKLDAVRKGYLLAIAELNGAIPASSQPTKQKCIHALMDWYRKNQSATIKLPPILPEPTVNFHLIKGEFDVTKYQILDQDTISELRHDIAKTFLPSWLERPPRNFGSPSHGKLKADHWRTVCTVSMVITCYDRAYPEFRSCGEGKRRCRSTDRG